VPGFDPAQFFADGYNGQSYSSVGASVPRDVDLRTCPCNRLPAYESILHYNTIGDIDGGLWPWRAR